MDPTRATSHGHAHGSRHDAGHRHAPFSPHPAARLPLSLMRMSLAQRLGLAMLASAALWSAVWLALG